MKPNPSMPGAMPRAGLLLVSLLAAALGLTPTASAEAPPIKKDKLQIVFLMGQSNMVGLADIGTSWYLTQPSYVPPRDLILKKAETFDWNNLYWQGVRYYQGPAELEKELAGLVDAREASRAKWRGRLGGEWRPEWGPNPGNLKGRDQVYAFLDKKAEEEGIYKRMAAILDGPENRFPAEKAYEEVIKRDEFNAGHLKRLREIYLKKNAKGEDFEPFLAAITQAKKSKENKRTPEETRAWLAKVGEETVGLPIAKRTRIFYHGAFEASDAPSNTQATAHGPLSIGWGGKPTMIGPEYAVGITLERLVDAPILLVKCAWGNTAVREAWRPASLDGVETPAEKAQREAWNATETALAKEEGREPKLRPAPEKTGKLSWCWSMALPAVKKVLENPGAYHPEYDPAKGYDIAGMVWFQGYSDMGNQAYGEQLTEMFDWFRKEINAPKMPIVVGTVGVGCFNHMAYQGEVNGGFVQAATSPQLKGGMDVVNTARYFPHESQMLISTLLSKEKGSPEFQKLQSLHIKINSNKGFHYYGSSKFFMLTGDAMARRLANLMAGGEPEILKEVETGGGVANPGEKPLAAPNDWDALIGRWRIVFAESEGVEIGHVKGNLWTFEKNTLKMQIGQNLAGMEFKADLDSTKKPGQLSLTIIDEAGQAVISRAIYEMDGNNLKVCLAFSSVPSMQPPFPAKFQARAGEPLTTLFRLERVPSDKP